MLRKDRTRILCREPKVRPRSRAPHVLHGRGPDLFEPTAQRRRIRNRVPGPVTREISQILQHAATALAAATITLVPVMVTLITTWIKDH